MKTNHNLSLLLILVFCPAFSLSACGESDSTTNDTNNDTEEGADTGSTDDSEDTSPIDSDDTGDSGGDEETDTKSDTESDTGLPASTGDDVLEETTQALSGIAAVAMYVDETVPAETATTAFYEFDEDWNQTVPSFCDLLGNHVSCPSITCDPETREATLSYESSFDGCDVTGCFFASKSVSGEVSIKKADDKEALVVTFTAFKIDELTLNGVVEVQKTDSTKRIAFSGEESADCPGLEMTNEAGYEACISGEVSVTAGDNGDTTDVEEKRTLEMTDVTFVSDHYDVVLNGTLTWLEGVDCFGPQTGTVTVSFESKEKDGEGDPLIAVSFAVNFDPENRSEIQALIQGSEAFADYETILPRGVFCSLPKIESVTFSHGSIEDFQDTGFIKKFILDVLEHFTETVLENPKAEALRALTQGLSADDILARLSEVGNGRLIRFIQAPVKGLCMLEDTATCPSITVTCGDPSGTDTEPTFFECNDTDIGYAPGEEGDPVPETMALDFNGTDGSCTTADGEKYGGRVIIERSLENPMVITLTFEEFTVYGQEGDNETADRIHGKIYGEVELTSEPCVADNQLLGTITFATPAFTDEGDMGLAFQKGTCPETIIVLKPFKIILSDESETPEGRDRATEELYLSWEQDGESYYISTLGEHVPAACADDSDWPTWAEDADADGVYYDLPMTCTCPFEGPVTLGTEAYAISVDNADCVELCITLGDISTGLDTACQNLCDSLVAEGDDPIEIANAEMSLSLGFKSACGDIAVCESATLSSSPDTECLDRNGDPSNNPCGTMLNLTNTDENKANCFEKCVTESGIAGSDFTKSYFEDQFGDLNELLSTLCVDLSAS